EGYRCNSGNWVPLNGPGYAGGYAGYFSSCPPGITCIQGSCTASRDLPISATFSSDQIDSTTTYLTWSGSGAGSSVVGNCSRDALIPINLPVTWFQRVLLR
ncbi:MAG: hypothetical protein OSB21_10480, partial [Myxococcota bacterium]|nr:hypothetical protein [Myxococcota bacterium]